ncbi:formimidoylglutamase [Lentibacillus kapialis]|uniref:Formimidoylglutamase n=1 Tax=Lentibacillus kapialis TaxID=340214 RepID=A0A917PVY2_9BACI|nr:formimidoylglutamase [Lentibacillus kapialis]GGJ94086.1 formimidoylglutamase [Lentibacillus kapialis]
MRWFVIYTLTDQQLWTGRVDDASNPAQFRFHQVVSVKDLDDLEAGYYRFGIIGFVSDEGVRRNKGRQGAAQGPDSIREQLAKLPYHLGEGITSVDTGNVHCEGRALEEAQVQLGQHTAHILNKHTTPIILGGGHETLYGHYLGVREYMGPDKTIGIINIDAHFDMRDDPEPSSGTMFKQILETDDQAGYLCLGIQEFGNTQALFTTARELGCDYILEQDIDANDYQDTFAMIDVFSKRHDAIIMTLCTDSIAAYAAPGVSAPSPLGLDPKTVKSLLTYVAGKRNVISFDISEVNPLVDESHKTVKLAANLVAETMRALHQ